MTSRPSPARRPRRSPRAKGDSHAPRITAGRFKGRRLSCPPGRDVRPMGDRQRQALFSWLAARADCGGGRLAGLAALDAFAGTGALGLEAYSRGAAPVVLVERAPRTLAGLRATLETLGIARTPEVTLLPGDALALGGALAARGPFALVLLDPPYAQLAEPTVVARLDEWLATQGLVAPAGIVALGHPSAWTPPSALGNLALTDRRTYGVPALAYYRAAARAPART